MTQRQAFVDLGASALDAIDGLVGATANAGQIAAIDTSEPTPTGQTGFVVRYTAIDNAGNAAYLNRTVRVVSPCETPSFLCPLPLVRAPTVCFLLPFSALPIPRFRHSR